MTDGLKPRLHWRTALGVLAEQLELQTHGVERAANLMCDSRDKPAEPDQTPGVFHHVFEFLHRFKIAKYHQHSRRFGAVTQREYGDERSAWLRAVVKFQRDVADFRPGPVRSLDHTDKRI